MNLEPIPATPGGPLAEADKVRRLVDDFYAGRKDTTLRVYRQGLGDFAGFLGVDERTIRRDWILARAWLERDGVEVPGDAVVLAAAPAANPVRGVDTPLPPLRRHDRDGHLFITGERRADRL